MPDKKIPVPLSMCSFQGAFAPSSINTENRTVEVAWYTGATVERYSWSEGRYMLELSMEPSAVDLKRLKCGTAPLLNAHSTYRIEDIIGVVENARIENGVGYATVRFSQRPEVEPIFQDVKDGIICNLSMGANIDAIELVESVEGKPKLYRATKWSVQELSLVPVGADPNAQTLGYLQDKDDPVLNLIKGDVKMEKDKTIPVIETTPNTKAELSAEQKEALALEERSRITKIQGLCSKHGMKEGFAAQYVESGASLESVRDAILEELAKTAPTVQSISIGAEACEKQRKEVELALLDRAAPGTVRCESNHYRGLSLIEMSRQYLAENGVNVEGASRREIAELALCGRTALGGLMSSGDLPLILGNTIARRLQGVYQEMAPTWQQFCTRATAIDFKEMTVVSLSGDVALKDVAEHGEYTRGSLSEATEKYKVKKSGRIIGLTLEMMMNDDLGAFNRIPMMMSAAAREKEAKTVFGILTTNANMSDGNALFSSGHNNIGTAGVPSETTLSEAVQGMYAQTNAAGDPINVKPQFLVHGPKNIVAVKKLLSMEMLAGKSADVNVFKGAFTPVLDPHITGKKWWLVTDPMMCDTIEYAYLDGQEGLYTEIRYGFDVDGMEIKARHVFGAKAIDHRGMYYNAGE
ncbi:MAG: hypothetical protein RRY12_01340 [Cloacibacillus sp.]